jgi:2-haloacid dehalogenase
MSYESIKADVKVCMFDQYGTVVDMQGGLTAIATPFLRDKGWSGNPNSFVTWWRRTHFENSMIDALLHREHTSYREIGHRSVAHVMDRAGIRHTSQDVEYLVGEIEKLKPFPEVPAALDKLRARYKLVVLSNGDPDMLETAKQYHKVAFDRVISVAEANSFKPTPRPRSFSVSNRIRFSLSRTTPSIASAPNRRECALRSSTGAAGRSARRRTSRTFWFRR